MVVKKMGDKVMKLVRGDITDLDVEAFVFDITLDAKLGTGYGAAIQQRGGISIQKELDTLGPVKTGEAVTTSGGLLKAKHIIHANGPKFHEEDTAGKLKKTVNSALKRVNEKGISQVAFPPIGTGLYQVPLDLCAQVMIDTVAEHLKGKTTLKEVIFVAVDSREYGPLEARLQGGA